MRKLIRLFACAAMVSLAAISAACSDDEPSNGGENGGNGGNGGGETELSDIGVMAYYTGDYYEVGTGNTYINFSTGDIEVEYDDFDEPVGYIGTGTVLCIDLNHALAADPDQVVLAAGTYTVDNSENYAAGTVNGSDSYLLDVVDGVATECTFTSGSVAIESLGDKIYKFDYDLVGSNGAAVKGSYTVLCRVINRSEEGVMSNLDADVEAKDLTEALFVYEGDLYETEQSDIYLVMMGDEDFDIATNYGPGNSIMLSLCVEPGSSNGIPAGTYDAFVDINTADELPVGSCIAGMYYWGQYLGCWYFNDTLQYESSLCGGSLTVANDGGVYTISGTLLDGKGRSVEIRYSGTPAIVDDTRASTHRASARKASAKIRK